MNEGEFAEYLIKNRGVAWVGKPDTLEVASRLVKEGYLKQDGEKEGKPVFKVTTSGKFYLATTLAAMGKEKMKEVIEAAFSEEQPKAP